MGLARDGLSCHLRQRGGGGGLEVGVGVVVRAVCGGVVRMWIEKVADFVAMSGEPIQQRVLDDGEMLESIEFVYSASPQLKVAVTACVTAAMRAEDDGRLGRSIDFALVKSATAKRPIEAAARLLIRASA